MEKVQSLVLDTVMSPFEKEDELTEFLAGLAIEECGELYPLLDGFMEPGKVTPTISDAFYDVTSIFMTSGFALGFLYGQNFTPTDPKVLTILTKLKKRLIKEDLLPYLPK